MEWSRDKEPAQTTTKPNNFLVASLLLTDVERKSGAAVVFLVFRGGRGRTAISA